MEKEIMEDLKEYYAILGRFRKLYHEGDSERNMGNKFCQILLKDYRKKSGDKSEITSCSFCEFYEETGCKIHFGGY